ncbi:hypothetical protein [Umezawaea sp.]|uniref:hypothetical protein n=1 Tax=Umezawaea sp. TaxID=1955258 RepID=UPI002ED16FC3
MATAPPVGLACPRGTDRGRWNAACESFVDATTGPVPLAHDVPDPEVETTARELVELEPDPERRASARTPGASPTGDHPPSRAGRRPSNRR